GDAAPLLDYLDTRAAGTRQRFSEALVRPPVAEIKAASEAPVTDAVLFLPAPGARGSVSYSSDIAVETTAPFVTAVTVESEDGVYGAGDVLNLTVVFSAPVTLVGAAAAPDASPDDVSRRAFYVDGNNTDSLRLQYVVQPGDYTPLLDYSSMGALIPYDGWRSALEDSGASILRAATTPTQEVDLTLALPGATVAATATALSIVGSGDQIALQTADVRAVSVSSPVPDDLYPLGAVIPIEVTFSVPAAVAAAELLTLELALGGKKTALAYYRSGNGTAVLTLAYTVAAGDATDDLDYAASAAAAATSAADGGDAAGQPVRFWSLPAPALPGSLGANKDIRVSGDALPVDRVWTDMPDGTYGVGQQIDVFVGFVFPVAWADESVPGNLSLAVGGDNGSAVAMPFDRYESSSSDGSSSGGNAVVFRYLVEAGQASSRLDYSSAGALAGALRFSYAYSNGSVEAILPAPGNPDSLGGGSAIIIDCAPPQVIAVATDAADGTYAAGATLLLRVSFTAPVVVSSSSSSLPLLPVLTLDASGDADVNASYASGSGTAELVFRYVVAAVDGSSDLDVAGTDALRGGDLRRLSTYPTTAADATLPCRGCRGSLGAAADVVVDAAAPHVLLVTSPATNGTYGVGDEIPIEVRFTSAVDVTGTPELRLNSGAAALAVFVSGGGTAVLTFAYAVGAGEATVDLDYADTAALALPANAAVFRRGSTTQSPMLLLLSEPGAAGSLGYAKDIVIDPASSAVLSVTSAKPNGEYGAGEEIFIEVHFSRPVLVLDGGFGAAAAFLIVDVGGATTTAGFALYAGGNGTMTLSFLYVVRPGDASSDLAYAAGALRGTFVTAAARPVQRANAALPAPGGTGSLDWAKNIVIDTSAPYVRRVTSLREGTYSAGRAVDLQVTFSKAVAVAGTPRIRLALDAAAAVTVNGTVMEAVRYATGSVILTFVYVVQPGDMAAVFTYAGPDALGLWHGASIRRASTHPTTDALLGLPAAATEANTGGRRVAAVSVVLEGLWHADSRDLNMSLLHDGVECLLLDGGQSSSSSSSTGGGRGRRLELGVPADRRVMPASGGGGTAAATAAAGAVERPSLAHAPLGGSYAFADAAGKNLAADTSAAARQSSAAYGGAAARAADGGTDGRFSVGSASHTAAEAQPWWEIVLPQRNRIGFLRVFGPQAETERQEVQVVTITAISSDSAVSGGYFRLGFVDADGRANTTDAIRPTAVGSIMDEVSSTAAAAAAAVGTGAGIGESMEALLRALLVAGAVSVSSSSGDVTDDGGYGGVTHRTWTITFPTSSGDVGQLFVAEDALEDGGSGHKVGVHTLQDGAAAGGISYGGLTHHTNATYAPAWLLLFDDDSNAAGGDGGGPLASLEGARALAVYSYYIASADRQLALTLPADTWARTVRIQLVGSGALSLAEVQIYEGGFAALSAYAGASPVPPRPRWDPLLAERSLTEAFAGVALSGAWTLRVADGGTAAASAAVSATALAMEHGEGGIGGWTLLLLDDAGIHRAYTMDAFATVETLPDYGTLSMRSGAALMPAAGMLRHVASCAAGGDVALQLPRDGGPGWQDGVPTAAACAAAFGAGPRLGGRQLGAVAWRNQIRPDADGGGGDGGGGDGGGSGGGGSAWLWYKPAAGFTGSDSFSFSVTIGGVK
ncbi:unnamed protein product, partial [Phaeothamnion confervicola]